MRAFNTAAVAAIWRRQLGSLLGNPLGYVFILAFVLVSAGFLFLQDAYFARNIADFGPLFSIMPWLLIVLVPALAMGSWARNGSSAPRNRCSRCRSACSTRCSASGSAW